MSTLVKELFAYSSNPWTWSIKNFKMYFYSHLLNLCLLNIFCCVSLDQNPKNKCSVATTDIVQAPSNGNFIIITYMLIASTVHRNNADVNMHSNPESFRGILLCLLKVFLVATERRNRVWHYQNSKLLFMILFAYILLPVVPDCCQQVLKVNHRDRRKNCLTERKVTLIFSPFTKSLGHTANGYGIELEGMLTEGQNDN